MTPGIRLRTGCALLLLSLLLAGNPAQAQAGIDSGTGSPPSTGGENGTVAGRPSLADVADDLRDRAQASPDSADYERSSLAPPEVCERIEDEGTRNACWRARTAYFEYYVRGTTHRSEVFEWQHFSTKAIFVVVLLLVAVGIYFAWVQFHQTGRPADTETELEITTEGFKVSSPVLGVIILMISLAFFYLYLVFVYPITELL